MSDLPRAFVLVGHIDFELDEVLGVYSSRAFAEENTPSLGCTGYDEFTIHEFPFDDILVPEEVRAAPGYLEEEVFPKRKRD